MGCTPSVWARQTPALAPGVANTCLCLSSLDDFIWFPLFPESVLLSCTWLEPYPAGAAGIYIIIGTSAEPCATQPLYPTSPLASSSQEAPWGTAAPV